LEDIMLDEHGKPVIETVPDEIVDPSPTPTPEDPSSSDPTPDDPTPEDPQSRRKPNAEKRIGGLVSERDYWRGRAESAELTRSVPVADETSTPAPDLDPIDFDSDAAYLRAVAGQTVASIRAESEAERIKQDAQKSHATLQKSAALGRATYADFDEVALNPSVPVTQSMMDAAAGEKWGDILYALGSEPGEAARIASLPPIQQAKEIGKIESRLVNPQTITQTNAPNPPSTVSGGGASPAPKDEGTMSRNELHSKWENERKEELKKQYG
jgi:hypothetical protein